MITNEQGQFRGWTARDHWQLSPSAVWDRLEGRGFISRRREGADRRVVRARISEQGLDLLTTIDERVRDLHARCLGHLGHRELTTFSALLKATVEPS